jgi:hypothetical protein
MIEAGAPSTEEGSLVLREVPAPPGVVILALPEVPRNAERAQSEGRARHDGEASAAGEEGANPKGRRIRPTSTLLYFGAQDRHISRTSYLAHRHIRNYSPTSGE